MPKPEVSVVIPAYNEGQVIGNVIKKIKELYNTYEIIVVNDGSKDNTSEAARAAGAIVIDHPYNIGNGAAVKTGIRNAKGSIIVLMDGDGQHEPEEIPSMIEHLPKYDMVVGARGSDSETSLHRDIANKLYNKFATYITKFKIEDLTSGFRAIKRKDATKFIYLLPNTFSYPTTITLSFLRTGRSIKYVNIKAKQRVGKSKIKLFVDGPNFLLIITKIATIFSPFRIFLPISLLFFFTGICYYLYTFSIAGRFTNMSALLFSTSVIIFLIGLVSEQISQLRFDKSEDIMEDK